LSIPSVLKKSSSGVSLSRGTLKCVAARLKISSSVCSAVGIKDLPSQPITNFQSQITNFPNYEITKSGQIRRRALILHKLPQPFFDSRTLKQVAKNLDLALQLFIWNWLHESLRRNRRLPIKFSYLTRRRPRYAQCFAFRRNLAD